MSECNCVDTGHKQDCPLGKDLRIAAMQEQIAILETSLAERWESLNVQDGVIAKQQEEIAALKAELARAREALIDAWFESEPGSRYQWQIAAIRANAEARYTREIAHAHKGEEG